MILSFPVHLQSTAPCLSDQDLSRLVSMSPLFKTLQEIQKSLQDLTTADSNQHLHNGMIEKNDNPRLHKDKLNEYNSAFWWIWSLKIDFPICFSSCRVFCPGEPWWATYPNCPGQPLPPTLCHFLVWLPGDAVACKLPPVPPCASVAGQVNPHFFISP